MNSWRVDGVTFAVAVAVHGLGTAFSQPLTGDLDANHEASLSDVSGFVGCLGGPGTPSLNPLCVAARFDEDEDVDLHDVAGFQNRFGFGIGPPQIVSFSPEDGSLQADKSLVEADDDPQTWMIPELPAAMSYDAKRNGLWIGTQRSVGGPGFGNCGDPNGVDAVMPIYFWDFGDDSVLQRFSLGFGTMNTITGELFLGFCRLDGVAYIENDPTSLADDEVWVSDSVNRNIAVFRHGQSPSFQLVGGLSVSAVNISLVSCTGLAIGADELYLSNDGSEGDVSACRNAIRPPNSTSVTATAVNSSESIAVTIADACSARYKSRNSCGRRVASYEAAEAAGSSMWWTASFNVVYAPSCIHGPVAATFRSGGVRNLNRSARSPETPSRPKSNSPSSPCPFPGPICGAPTAWNAWSVSSGPE